MAATIRLATANDALPWLDLVQSVLGNDYPSKDIYDPAWIGPQIDSETGHETWVADDNGRLMASISFLRPESGAAQKNPIANIGRALHRIESYADGSSDELLEYVGLLLADRCQMGMARVLANDNTQQILYEKHDYVCVGFQPFKHILQERVGVLFYVRATSQVLVTRLPLSESLPQVSELSAAALDKLQIPSPTAIRDGVTGYPLQAELKAHEATVDDYELWRAQAQSANPPVEISGGFNHGLGLMRVPSKEGFRAMLGQRDDKIVAGTAFYCDEFDRCVRFIDAFSTDDISLGSLLQSAVKAVQQQFSPVYVEVDILASAPRLLKSAEQLGFVPVAYLPAFFHRNGAHGDVVKLMKLNMPYALDGNQFTAQARSVAEIVDRNFQDQKVGVAIINLLRGLPIFEGLGDGELRKIARLFTQKLFRPGESIFKRGDSGDEAFIVMRGQVDIKLDESGNPIASIASGKVFGELAFLDGAPRNAFAVASQASILLVVHRSALNELIQREPHLGMVVMRNMAMDLSNKLRAANTALAAARK